MQSETEVVAQEAVEPGAVADPQALSFHARARVETLRFKQDKGYSLRRMIYVFGTVSFLLVTNTAFVAFKYEGPLVEKYVTASMDLIMWITISYLSMGALDRSNVLRRMGEGFYRRRWGAGDGDPRT